MNGKYIFRLIAASLVMLLMSCSGNDYLKVLPRESIAMASLDLNQLASMENPDVAPDMPDYMNDAMIDA